MIVQYERNYSGCLNQVESFQEGCSQEGFRAVRGRGQALRQFSGVSIQYILFGEFAFIQFLYSSIFRGILRWVLLVLVDRGMLVFGEEVLDVFLNCFNIFISRYGYVYFIDQETEVSIGEGICFFSYTLFYSFRYSFQIFGLFQWVFIFYVVFLFRVQYRFFFRLFLGWLRIWSVRRGFYNGQRYWKDCFEVLVFFGDVVKVLVFFLKWFIDIYIFGISFRNFGGEVLV